MNKIAKSFDWNVICEVCRKQIKASEASKRWDGLIVCQEDWESRHPLDYPHPPVRDQNPLPFTRPEPDDVFVSGICTTLGRSAISGDAVSGCSIAGLELAVNDYSLPTASFNSSTL